MSAAKKGGKIRIENTRHDDKRVNIPTEELRDFMSDEAQSVEKVLYPRDPSLDPQLVWSGKDKQDREDLVVDAPPIYIQEKIHPQVIIEDVRAQARSENEPQAELFSDFNGIEFEDLIDFYKHQQNWSNRMILGDALQVMGSLAEKEGLRGKIQTIYIDPPYGIKFGSNWQVSTRKSRVKDGSREDLTRQPEQVRAFRDTWEKGIHSYLSYLRDRLILARDLLTESGSIFIQIGDENVHLVRSLLDEVFGSDNFRSLITYRTSVGLGAGDLDNVANYILWYSKTETMKYHPLYSMTRPGEAGASRYKSVILRDGSTRKATESELDDPSLLPAGAHLYRDQGLTSRTGSSTTMFPFEYRDRTYRPTTGGWRTSAQGLQRVAAAGRLLQTGNTLSFRKNWDDFSALSLTNFWDDVSGGITSRSDPKVYVVQTGTKIVERCMLMTTDPGDLVLDPTCGSGTTAYVAEQWGRRWITIDTSRVALALARTRLMTAKSPYYLLADSPEGVRKESEITGQVVPLSSIPKTRENIKEGFVYKRLPHVTLKSIANNPDIREGMSREEIDAAIARYADSETLFDQPYEDKKRLRVSGPFTVESLSPHRVLSTDEAVTGASENGSNNGATSGLDFVTAILDNLKKSGVQNTVKNERLKFDRLESHAGAYIHAEGEYTEQDGTAQRVAVCIGPEHGTVGPQLVKEAAKEAVKGTGFDLLVVCGFAFDPHVSEEARQYGKLSVLVTKMNPDLAMGDELLKKTGSGNLFMVFGEPDIEIEHQDEGKLIVEINGVDVYDPTTGQIRSNSTDDIACWFLDTNYNDESFFVRHAYFTGAGNPYDKLKKALKAEIDEDTWSSLYSTRSRPFDPPKTGKLAIKVINHYGDEVVKICSL